MAGSGERHRLRDRGHREAPAQCRGGAVHWRFPLGPACTVHVPTVSKVMVAPLVPLEEHTVGVGVVVKVTVNPDEAVALTVSDDLGQCRVGGFGQRDRLRLERDHRDGPRLTAVGCCIAAAGGLVSASMMHLPTPV